MLFQERQAYIAGILIAAVAAFFSGYFVGKDASTATNAGEVRTLRSEGEAGTLEAGVKEREVADSGNQQSAEENSFISDTVSIPRYLAEVAFQNVYLTNVMQIAPDYQSMLGLSDNEKGDVEGIVRRYTHELGAIEARNAKLVQDERGEYYVLEPNPDANALRERFEEDILASLGGDKARAKVVANVLGNSKALSGFGVARREVYVRDYTIDGKSFTSVEIMAVIDPVRKVSRSNTVPAVGEFVVERYPFLNSGE